MLFLLPDSPSTARFFTPREAAVHVEIVATNKQGIKNHVFKRYQAIQAAKDPKTWILFLMAVSGQIPTAASTSENIPSITLQLTMFPGISLVNVDPPLFPLPTLSSKTTKLTHLKGFASINISSFGFDTLGSQYMLIPGGAIQFFSILLGGWVATKWTGTRCLVMVIANTICIIGSGLLVGLPASNKVGFSTHCSKQQY
jgi:hypothetical protein